MSGANFPQDVFSLGVPSYLGGYITQGNTWFVKPYSGSNGNTGDSPDNAFKTVAYALGKATANQNDVIYLFAENNTASKTTDYQAATLTWNKDLTHLIGVAPPVMCSSRARIAQLSTATGVSPLVNVTANCCVFKNIEFFHGVADATSLINLQVTGKRNVFENCNIAGIGDPTQVTTGAASLALAAAEENVFRNCVIGLDTVAVDNTTNGEIYCTASATRNAFIDCTIQRFISNASYTHVTIGANGIDRWMIFKNCLFLSESTNDAVTQSSAMTIPAMSQGYVILQGCQFVTPGASGAGAWDSNSRGRTFANMVAPAAAGAGGLSTKK
jgi:hypothetical protein